MTTRLPRLTAAVFLIGCGVSLLAVSVAVGHSGAPRDAAVLALSASACGFAAVMAVRM